MDARGRIAAATPQSPTSPRAAADLAKRPSWDDVPDNILVTISAFLRCRADRVHMASANGRWATAVLGLRRPPPPLLPPLPPLPPQLPWLIFPSTAAPTFYSLITGFYHRLRGLPPDLRRARCRGSGDRGWLVLALDAPHAHTLYNLNTGRRIPLPPGFLSPTDTGVGARLRFPFNMRAAALSSAPYMVAAIVLVANGCGAAFWREGRESWIPMGDLHAVTEGLEDLLCYMGRFYFLTSDEDVIRFSPGDNPNGNAPPVRKDYNVQKRADYDVDVDMMRGVGPMKRYLVVFEQAAVPALLMVVRYVYSEGEDTQMIRVFQLSNPTMTNGMQPTPVWEDLNGQLDGRMLFLGPGCSRTLEVARYDGFEEAMIYFLDESMVYEPSADGGRWYSFTDMGRYSTTETTIETWPPGYTPMSDNAPPTWWLH